MEARIAFGAVIAFVVICFIIANYMGKAQQKKDNEAHRQYIERLRKQSDTLKGERYEIKQKGISRSLR